jgi:Zn-dependent protease with chaperone function
VTSVLWTAAVGLAASLMRTAWLGAASWLVLRRVPRQPAPAELDGVVCLVTDTPEAFCAGLFRPRVHVTTGLLRTLAGRELDAVLAHEREHARRRDPLRLALARSLAEVLFFVPLVRWWASREQAGSEMRADRVATLEVGRAPLAMALWRLGGEGGQEAAAAFSGAARLRVAQLMGEKLPRRRPSGRQWAVSALGVAATICLAAAVGTRLPPR